MAPGCEDVIVDSPFAPSPAMLPPRSLHVARPRHRYINGYVTSLRNFFPIHQWRHIRPPPLWGNVLSISWLLYVKATTTFRFAIPLTFLFLLKQNGYFTLFCPPAAPSLFLKPKMSFCPSLFIPCIENSSKQGDYHYFYTVRQKRFCHHSSPPLPS